jgi:hypothetical protein
LALVVGIALAGCTKPVLREKPPPDPLFSSKKPIEGKALISEVQKAPSEDYSPPPRPVVDDDFRPVHVPDLRPVNDRR